MLILSAILTIVLNLFFRRNGRDGRAMAIDDRARKAIEASDTDELVIVDGYAESREGHLVELRRRCDEAVTRGKQLWGDTSAIDGARRPRPVGGGGL